MGGTGKRIYIQEGRRVVADDDSMARIEHYLRNIDQSLMRIGDIMGDMLDIMAGKVAIRKEDLADMGRGAMPAFTPDVQGTRHTIMSDGKTYVREDIGGGRWFKYRIDEHGQVCEPQVEMPNGERIDVDL